VIGYVIVLMSDLLEAYRRTSFFADTPQGRLRLRLGESSPELDRVLEAQGARSWAYVTAFNPASIVLSDDENERRQSRLEYEVSSRGYTTFRGEGVGDDGTWPAERGLLIVGIGDGDAIELGRAFGQRAIVYGVVGAVAVLLVCA
jgi:hypothetical protein